MSFIFDEYCVWQAYRYIIRNVYFLGGSILYTVYALDYDYNKFDDLNSVAGNSLGDYSTTVYDLTAGSITASCLYAFRFASFKLLVWFDHGHAYSTTSMNSKMTHHVIVIKINTLSTWTSLNDW